MLLRALGIVVLTLPLVAQRPGPGPAITSVELRVLDDHGAPMQTGRVQLIGAIPGAKVFRTIADWPSRALAPRDFTADFAVIADLPVGDFALRIETDDYAIAVSETFRIPARTAPRLTVRLHPGATIEGVVRDPDGKPLAGAVVDTEDADTPGPAHPIAAMLQGMLAPTKTIATVRTDDAGHYSIPRVAAGAYRVVAQHPAFAPSRADLKVLGDGTQTAPSLTLVDGALVVGVVTRNGKPEAGAEVVLQTAVDVDDPLRLARMEVNLTATTDAQGRFRMPGRVARNHRYALMANGNGSPLEKGADRGASKREFVPAKSGAEQVEVVVLPPR